MLEPAETRASLEGAARLAIGKADGMAYFGHDMDAFWRSFGAMLVAGPVYLAYVWAEYMLRTSGGEAVTLPHLFLVRLVHYPVDWLAYPVAFILIAQIIGVTKRYGIYVIAFNWTSVIILAAIALPTLLHAFFGLRETLAGIFGLVLLLAAFRLRWLIARLALEVDRLTAAGLVFVEFALGLLVARLFDSLI